MVFYLDDRTSKGISITYETQREILRSAGKNADGLDRFVYIPAAPIVIKKITTKYVGTKDYWESKLVEMRGFYDAAADAVGILSGTYIENISIDGGYFIIDGEEFFSGSVAEVDFGTNVPEVPPAQFKVVVSESSNAAPSGYMPYSNKAFYTNDVFSKQITESSTMSLSEANGLLPLQKKYGGVLTSINISSLREIAGIKYVDASLTYTEEVASIYV